MISICRQKKTGSQTSEESLVFKRRLYLLIGIIITVIVYGFTDWEIGEDGGMGAAIALIIIGLIILGVWLYIGYLLYNIKETGLSLTLNNIGMLLMLLLPGFLILLGLLSPYDPEYKLMKLLPKVYCGIIILIGIFSIIYGIHKKDYRFMKGSIIVVCIGIILLYFMMIMFY